MAGQSSTFLCFGQLVIGPPGSGKTTYCSRMAEFLRQLGRKVILINIDPANEVSLPYDPDINISSLVKTEEVMDHFHLGPNGGLMYSMNYLSENVDWLLNAIKSFSNNQKAENEATPYLIIDCPGQIELYTHDQSFKKIISKLTNAKENIIDARLVAVYLLDAHYCSDPGKFISSLLSSLSAMLHLELPHVNVLSKIDLISKYGETRFGIEYFCEVMDLSYLVDELSNDPFLAKFRELSKRLVDVVENYSLVSFSPLNINDNRTIIRLLRLVDQANGYYPHAKEVPTCTLQNIDDFHDLKNFEQ